MNGGAGCCVTGFSSTPVTSQGIESRNVFASDAALAPSSTTTSAFPGIPVAATKSFPMATRFPSIRTSVAVNSRPFPAQRRLEVPESGFPEGFPLLLPLDDQPHRDALHATRTQFWRNPFPENRRHLVSEETIQDPSAFLRIHQVAIELAGMFDRTKNRFFRDLMEDDAADGHLRLQQFEEMPTDGLSLAVRIRREENFRRVLKSCLHVTDRAPAVRRDDVIRLEIVINVHRHRTPFLAFDRFRHLAGVVRKVANVADAGHDAIPASQEAGKGPGLRGGLDDQ